MRRMIPPCHIAKRIDEMPVGRDMDGFRVFRAHHGLDDLSHALAGVDQEQVIAGLDVVVERFKFLVFR